MAPLISGGSGAAGNASPADTVELPVAWGRVEMTWPARPAGEGSSLP